MRVRVNDIDIEFPSEIKDITLGQRIEFHDMYGREIDERAKEIEDMEDDTLKDLEAIMFNTDVACKTFSFFSGISLEVVQESTNINEIMMVYASLKELLMDSVPEKPLSEFEWKGETWVLHEPELSSTSTMTFGEIVDSKQIVQDLYELGSGKWECILRLCAIYLRKKGEVYHRSMAEENSERLQLMRELPMDIALQVGFFLTSSMSLFRQHLLSSGHQE